MTPEFWKSESKKQSLKLQAIPKIEYNCILATTLMFLPCTLTEPLLCTLIKYDSQIELDKNQYWNKSKK